MAENAVSVNEKTEQQEIKAGRTISNNRRYVGSKETVAYVVYDISQSFNINKYQDIFITDIVQVGLKFQTVVTFINGIWDVINDIFLAAIVDRTRTRLGKFRPWLLFAAGPGFFLSIIYWLLPILFANTGPYNVICTPKVRHFWRCIFFMGKTGRKNKVYSAEFKIGVIMDMREHHLSYHETVRKYELGNDKTGGARNMLQRWERIYLEEGAEGLMKERRGRACAASGTRKGRPPKLDKKVEEDLIAENQRLRMEIEYLKKLDALVQKRLQEERKKQQ